MGGFHVAPGVLQGAATTLTSLGTHAAQDATNLEGACAAPPDMGDIQAGAIFQQAVFDWTQTRFEDLSAAASHLASLAQRCRQTAQNYASMDAASEREFSAFLQTFDVER